MSDLYIGLMSGTSLDGVDGVLVDFSAEKLQVLQHVAAPFPANLRAELLALNQAGDNELHRAALAGNALARTYAQVVAGLLSESGIQASEVRAVGAHGQTVRHRPGEFDGDTALNRPATGYTLQLNNPALLAELTGMDVIADFRSRDVAAGGQGAPLVPAFHQSVFSRPGETVQVLNVGGIANVTVLGADGSVLGFDCGPGNALMDGWCQTHTGQPYDAAGAWAAGGQVVPGVLAALMTEPYLAKAPPKSTGRDLFNAAWLAAHLSAWRGLDPVDVQATLTEFTAKACSSSILCYENKHETIINPSLIVCGGGALNLHLMQRLQAHLPRHRVASSTAWCLPPLEVEATAFAWLARKMVRREAGSLERVTGADGARVLGALYPA